MPNVSIREIARDTGFAVTTVSYALRGRGKLSPATRGVILRKAEELGYRPDPTMRELMNHVRKRKARPITRALALLNLSPRPRFRDMGWRAAALADAMSRRAGELGYHLDELWIGDLGRGARALDRVLAARGMPGVVLTSPPANFTPPDLDWARLSAVCIDAAPTGLPLKTVGHAHFAGMRTALREAAALGYRRIGLALANPEGNPQRDQWPASYFLELERDASLTRIPIHERPPGSAGAVAGRGAPELERESFLGWVERERPEVVVSQERRVKGWLESAGLEVPRDVGFVLLDCPPGEDAFSGIDQDVPRLGRTVIDVLAADVEHGERGPPATPVSTRLEGRWVAGRTLRAPG